MYAMSSQQFEAEIRKQIEEKKAQKLREQIQDQQLILNHYKNYQLGGGATGQLPQDVSMREQQLIQMMNAQGLQSSDGIVSGAGFKGDMNKAQNVNNQFIFDQKPGSLFDDGFLRKMNENTNIINSAAFQTQQQDLTQMSERERRIFLRDKERERRNQQPSAGISSQVSVKQDEQYGGGFEPSPIINQNNKVQDIFGNQNSQQISKRDQIWAQKAQQRLGQPQSLPPTNSQYVNLQNQANHLPSDQFVQNFVPQQQNQIQTPANQMTPRTSLAAAKLKQAIDLDTSVNKSLQFNNMQQYNLQDKTEPQIQIFGLSQQDKRVQQNAQRKKEYQDHLLAQQAKKPQPRDGQIQQAESLVLGGLSQIGDHQYKQSEEKLRKQLEYKQILEQQQMQKQLSTKPPLQQSKQQIADEVFNQVLGMHKQVENLIPQQDLHTKVGSGVRALSAVGANRQQELAKLQMQETNDPFFASRNKEEQEKQRQIEKKREYAAMLQQQMQSKRIEQEKAQELRHKLTQPVIQKQIPDFTRPPVHQNVQKTYDQPIYLQQQQVNQDPYSYQMPGMNFEQQQFQYRAQAPMQNFDSLGPPQPSSNTYQDRPPVQNNIYDYPQPSQHQLNPKDEYRKQLELQMKEAAEKKQRQKEEQLLYERRNDKDLAEVIQSQPPSATTGVRKGATDITRMPKQEDERQIMAKLQYQEELRQQVEDQKRRKEMLQKQAKLQEEQDEHRMMSERNKLAGREKQEIKQEGGKVAEENKPKRQVRRDQFEPSQENPTVKTKNLQQQITTELFQNSPPNPIEILKIPSNQVNEENNNIHQGNEMQGFAGMPPVGRPKPFLIEDNNFQQQQQQQQFVVNPHPLNNFAFQQQPATPISFTSQNQMPQQQFYAQLPGMGMPMQTQSDWSQQQATKMFEDQQKMIQLYQQALEQILKYRNQYFEQAMDMRENILKEREQLLEFEKLKQQQLQEMQQIQAVKQQLGQVRATHQPLSANLTKNLDQYIGKQKQQLLEMSQSQSSQMKQLMSSQPQFTVETSRVQITKQIQIQDFEDERKKQLMSPGAVSIGFQVAAQVEEIAEHIERIGQEQIQQELDFEESLSSHTKLVKVPQNNLAAKANKLKQSPLRSSLNNTKEDQLLATWDEASLDKVNQKQNISARKRSPFTQKESAIREIPEEDNMHSPVNNKRKGMSDFGLNDRDSSDERQQQRTIESHYSRKQQLSTSGMIDRKATITGSSFYDQTLKNQRKQAETQQAEMQKQLKRIFGNTSTSPGLVQVLDQNRDDDIETPSLHEIVETIDQGEHEDEGMPSEINIANTRVEHFDRVGDSSNDMGKNTSRFLNEQRSSQYKLRASQEMILEQQALMRSYRPQSAYGESDQQVPVVHDPNNNLQHTQFSNQMMSEYNFQVQEEEQDPAEGTINYLKMMNPDILQTTEGTQKFQNLNADSSQQQQRQFAQQMLLTQSDEDMQTKDEQIHEEIYSEYDDATQREQDVIAQVHHKTTASKQSTLEQQEKKNREMMEIAALIQKVQLTTNNAIESAQRKKDQSKISTPAQPRTPNAVEVTSQNTLSNHQEDDVNILADLDRIINNLERQQKNMATFGLQDQYEDHSQSQNQVEQSMPSQKQHRAHWQTLQEAREARPTTGKSTGKAPLAPKPKLQEDLSKSKLSSRLADGSPQQRVGKFSQMAIVNQTDLSDHSKDRSLNSKSPQRIGKYAQMALDDHSRDRSLTSKSPQRVGKFTQMALDSSFKSKGSHGSISPQNKLGKFVQMALQNQNDLSQDDIQNISQKYLRNPSRERDETKSQQSVKLADVGAASSILRPVSGSHSSRYQGAKPMNQNARPFSTVVNQKQYNNTPGGLTTLTSQQKQQEYYFDDEEDNHCGQTENTQRFVGLQGQNQFNSRPNHGITHEQEDEY